MNLIRRLPISLFGYFAIASLFLTESQAIIIRHDVGPSRYEVSPSAWPAVFFLERQGRQKVCVATVIHPQWALTAAHCIAETSLGNNIENGRKFSVKVGSQLRQIDKVSIHPDFNLNLVSDVDLALLRFQAPSNIPQVIPLQREENEFDQLVSLLGWGYFGLGTTGRQYDNGQLRLATNRISSADRRLRIVFDDPRDTGSETLELEGMPGLGDSGGPALMRTEAGFFLAGITVGEIEGEGFSEETQGKYGSIAVYERISQHVDWIETVIGSTVAEQSF